MHEHSSYPAPISPSSREFTMHSPATTHATTPTTTHATTPATTPPATPAKPRRQDEHSDIPDHLPTKPRVLTNDFYLDTHFNPVWMSGPHVFSFAKDGTVVRPETYSLEPYLGYHASRFRRLESVNASHFQGFSPQDQKPWKNVAITEQDDAEFAAIEEREATNAGGERQQDPYGQAMPDGEEPELVYTWPPMPHGQ